MKELRLPLIFVGIGALVIFIGLLFINPRFTKSRDNMNQSLMATSTLALSSTAFQDNTSIPSQYTCDGNQTSPPLSISGAPTGTKTFALIVQDPDVPKQLKPDGVFVHWVLFNIPEDTKKIPEGGSVGTQGANGAGKNAYAGPCPPPQYEPSEHRYFFTLYALDTKLDLAAGASKEDVLKAMEGHVLAQSQLTGRYKKK